MQAVIHDAKAPPIIALKANNDNSFLLLGAIIAKPPIWIPIDPKLANPHNA